MVICPLFYSFTKPVFNETLLLLQLAQVQSLVRTPHQIPTSNHHHHHHPIFPTKMVDDTIFTPQSSPPHGVTAVNQLLRRAAMQHRRDRRISLDPETEHKRARAEHLLTANNNNNNNNELNLTHPPPQTQPTDFSPSAMKNHNTVLNLNTNSMLKGDVEGNGISSTENESTPCSPSPIGNVIRGSSDDVIKSEPMELLCGANQEENSNDSDTPLDNGPTGNLPQGPHSGSSGGDHDDHDSPMGPYLTPTESKLFAATAGSFNFSMAALAADPTGLGGSCYINLLDFLYVESNFLEVFTVQNKNVYDVTEFLY